MSKETFYKVAALSLLLLNITVITYILVNRNLSINAPQHPTDIHLLLQLNAKQERELQVLVEKHRAQIRNITKRQKELLHGYFAVLANAEGTLNSAQLLERVEQEETKKIRVTYQHFKDIRALLTSEQQQFFPAFMEEALQQILEKPNGGKQGPKQ